MSDELRQKAKKNVETIVRDIFDVSGKEKSVVVFDKRSPLSEILAEAYRDVLPQATFISFDEVDPAEILSTIATLEAKDFVALVQSSNFRLNEFRLRVELFKKGLKVIEHPHVARMISEDDIEVYIESLYYDKEYYRTVGPKLKMMVDGAKKIVVESENCALEYLGPFEDAKLNIGDYSSMKNWGGQFPIGEVFTEPSDLSKVNGTAKLMAFGDKTFKTNLPTEPIEIIVKEGIIVDVKNSTPDFDAVLAEIREEESLVQIRELGMGMNKAMTNTRTVPDIGTYERKCGIHMSLGSKHTIYAKKEFSRKHSRFHVDVFVDVKRVLIDDEVVFEGGQYII
jgi:aminopeptidase